MESRPRRLVPTATVEAVPRDLHDDTLYWHGPFHQPASLTSEAVMALQLDFTIAGVLWYPGETEFQQHSTLQILNHNYLYRKVLESLKINIKLLLLIVQINCIQWQLNVI